MARRKGIEGLREDLERQRAEFTRRAPCYERILAALLALLDGDAALRQRLASALGARTFFAPYDRPLLILAALRLDAMRTGPAHPLYDAIVTPAADAARVTPEAVASAMGADRPQLFETIAARHVQTNETRRAIAWLWPAALAGCSNQRRPLALVDIGASAGLNLVAHELPRPWMDERGHPLPTVESPRLIARLGLDARPLDASNPNDADWLRACIWPGDAERLERLDAALAAWCASPARVERADIAAVAPRIGAQLAELPEDALVLAYQTVVREYLPPDARAAHEAAMDELLATAAPGRLVWAELEAAGTPGPANLPAALTLHVRGPDGVETLELARSHWHPSVVRTNPGTIARFTPLLASRPGHP